MELYKYIFAIVTCFIVLLPVCLSTDCVENGLNPDNEDDLSLFNFAKKMEKYSGMNNDNFSVTINNCKDSSTCVVNQTGQAIWQARSKFYGEFMMSSPHTEDQRETLDGCLCYSRDESDFKTCMVAVRKKMIEDIDVKLVNEFTRIVENNSCAMYTANCIQLLK